MSYVAERTCTDVCRDPGRDSERIDGRSLRAFRQVAAYVLLGEPGAGKTTIFKREAAASDGVYVSARDFLAYGDRPEWHAEPLFIDGLDEIRAGTRDVRDPFDRIRAQLNRLGRPKFRLSCREADWLGPGDGARLEQVSQDNRVVELHLDALADTDIRNILAHELDGGETTAFIAEAEQRGLSGLLENPHILKMLAKAVSPDGRWPTTRQETFDLACRTLLREFNDEHVQARRDRLVDIECQMRAAGFLCALQLIADTAGYTSSPAAADESCPALTDLQFGEPEQLQLAVKSNVYRDAGNERRTFVHRTIAEFLAARYLAERIEHYGLPLGRVLALLTGEDCGVVTALRGLFAWLATIAVGQRSTLIEFDPLGLVLYGDTKTFSREDKQRILDGLRRQASQYPGFRRANRAARPFGALATRDMEPAFRAILTRSDRSDAQQAVAHCLLDALRYGDQLTGLADVLMATARDPAWWAGVRQQALNVLILLVGREADWHDRLVELLDDVNDGKVADREDDC